MNRLLPIAVVGAFALNAATGGALENVEFKVPGARGPPPGTDQAKAVKARSEAKQAEAYEKFKKETLGR